MASCSEGIPSCELDVFLYAQGLFFVFKKMLHSLIAPFAPMGLLVISQDEE